MRKNVASQIIGAQLVSATDGSAFTGSVTVAVTGDGGTQATGSVGSGACTHEGNGFHTYAPAQAETNYDHVAFTFTGTGAVPATVQVYPAFPQTGDSFARIGAAGAGLTALGDTRLANLDDAVSDAVAAPAAALTAYDPPTNAEMVARTLAAAAYFDPAADGVIVTTNNDKTGYSLTATTGLGNQTGAVGSVTGNVGGNVTGSIGSLATQAKADVNAEADTAISDAALATAANLAIVAGYLDTEIAAIKAKTDNLPSDPADASDIAAAIAALNDLSTSEVGDAVLDEVVEGAYTLRQLIRLIAAASLGKLSGAATTSIAIRDLADSKDRISATVDEDGNRSAVTLDAT